MNKKHQESNIVEGVIKRHPDGYGFLIPDGTELPDIYVPRNSMSGAMTNDRVRVKYEKEKGGDRLYGSISAIISRATKKVVGRYKKLSPMNGIISDQEQGWGADLKIPSHSSRAADDGDLVAVEIISYPDSDKGFVGRVIEVMGDATDPIHDIKRVVFTHQLPHEFSAGTMSEAHLFRPEVSPADLEGRQDLRKLPFITIDGATAKDFDDAIYVASTDKGFHLYVAIADVSHYVKPGSNMDQDAYQRGTSTYFPAFVIPMLPEILSNELCSLKPNVPRLALTAEMLLDFHGNVQKTDFYESVIQSQARVTYGEAQEVVDGANPDKLKHVRENILRAADLAKILMAKRFAEGSLDLDIPETEIEIDAAGNPVDIQKAERLFAHRLIEELMLIANVAVAKFFKQKNAAGIYRVHEPPDPDAIQMLEKYLHNFGYGKNLSGGKLQKKLTKALQEFADKPEAQVLNVLTLRSMSQAKYSSSNVGHFGLGFDDYTHFTSPIRRYPDLIVHRILKSLIVTKKSYPKISEEYLSTAGVMLSACEQRSVKAERQLKAIKRARFMHQHLGEEFTGLISSVAKFGVFVLLRAFDIDGLVKIENLGNDHFEFDEENLRLVGKKSKLSYNIGDAIEIQVASCNIELGQIDFVLPGQEIKPSADSDRRPKFRKDHKERGTPKKDRQRIRKARFSQRRRKG